MTKSIMIQGTASSVGKSLISELLCKVFTEDGYNTCPFKSQNMCGDPFKTEEGFVMALSQAKEAMACNLNPNPNMNPIYITYESNKYKIYVKGIESNDINLENYNSHKPMLKDMIYETYLNLSGDKDIMVIEGGGSPAEINLNKNDIVNMGMAKMAKSPVILVGDISLGGVFASILGTLELLKEDEKKYVKGIIINKFIGDINLLKSGLEEFKKYVNIPIVGVMPSIKNIPKENISNVFRENMNMNLIYEILNMGV